jgi:hypothetical protein
MHPATSVRAALDLAEGGRNATEVAQELGIARSTVRDWVARERDEDRCSRTDAACDRCGQMHDFQRLEESYVYLLGLYLGDGCISAHPRKVYRLRIMLDVKYPGIIHSAAATMGGVRGGRTRIQVRPSHCVEVSSYWRCWPCLFPQHGPGRKHKRSIVLTDWQQQLADRWPDALLRGLIQSDGCRFQNTGRGGWFSPRYAFSNRSADIHSIFRGACRQLDLRWTASGSYTTYVSRKADVAILDEFIGPKR